MLLVCVNSESEAASGKTLPTFPLQQGKEQRILVRADHRPKRTTGTARLSQAAQGHAPRPPDLVLGLGKDLSIAGGAQTSSANHLSIYSTAL